MRTDDDVLAFGLTVISVTYLLSMFALLWQSMDAVAVVVIGMGGVTILVLVTCEMQEE